jgi:hypothetical protein
MALWLVAPARMISSIMGRTLAANRLAFRFTAALPSFAASATFGITQDLPAPLGGRQGGFRARREQRPIIAFLSGNSTAKTQDRVFGDRVTPVKDANF